MSETKKKGWLKKLLRPSPSHSILALVGIGLMLGILAVIAFDTGLHAISTEKYCISCHEMRDNPYAQLQKTAHFNNASGVRPTCSDCHVPKEFVPRITRKVIAAREVWGSIIGVIDTPEEYAAHLPVMKQREIARMQANKSQECRNCHQPEHMLTELQSKMAQRFHQPKRVKDKSCIDCHEGIAHPDS